MWYRKAKEQMQAEAQQRTTDGETRSENTRPNALPAVMKDGQTRHENVRPNTPPQPVRDGMSRPDNVRRGVDETEGSNRQA